jgi:hypothetical protein
MISFGAHYNNTTRNQLVVLRISSFQSQGKSLLEALQMAAGAMEGAVSTCAAIISYAEGF